MLAEPYQDAAALHLPCIAPHRAGTRVLRARRFILTTGEILAPHSAMHAAKGLPFASQWLNRNTATRKRRQNVAI